jgi:hypothetical protein
VTPSGIIYRSIQLGTPGQSDAFAACTGSSGLTKYIDKNFAITNGLAIYNDSTLLNKTYTSNPGGFSLLIDGGTKYAVTFDASGNVNTVTDCSTIPSITPTRTPIPPSITPSPTGTSTLTKYNAILQQCDGFGQCIDNGITVVIDSATALSSSTYYSEGGGSGTVYYVIGIAKSGTSTYTFINPQAVSSGYCCL